MEESIDPRCEKIRGTHWPKKGRQVVWNSRRGKPSWPAVHQPHQQAGHMDASDPIRPSKNSCGTGAVHIWVPDQRSRRSLVRDDKTYFPIQFQTADTRPHSRGTILSEVCV